MTRALQRAISRPRPRRAEGVERCDLCGLDVPDRHRHVLDEQAGELMCTCRACSLLFQRDAAGRGHYRLVPEGRTRLAELPDEELDVPVGLVFVVPHDDGTATAHYPSPMGTTRHEVDAAVWARMRQRRPELAAMTPEVEALLLNTARGAGERWLVPIDDCFRLVALVRREWQGLSGGTRVWPEVQRFFDRLAGPDA